MKALKRSAVLDGYVLKSFFPIFLVSMVFFVLVLEMADILLNIVQYVQNEASGADIVRVALLYLPKCISWALPIAMLFSVSYELGTFFTQNELIVVYGSGVNLFSFMLPVFIFSAIVSIGFLAFEDHVVIPSFAAKKDLSARILKTGEGPTGMNDVTIVSDGGRFIWNMRYYDTAGSIMTGVTLVERDQDGSFVMRLNAQSASWTGSYWRFSGVRRFFKVEGGISEEAKGNYEDPSIAEPPESFHSGGKPIEEMPRAEARRHLDFLKRTGLPRAAQEAEYYRRLSYALTPLLVSLLSVSLAGMFRKNILLMSLLVSLVGATVYYVVQMISMLLAKNESISPLAGAMAPLLLFALLTYALFRVRRA